MSSPGKSCIPAQRLAGRDLGLIRGERVLFRDLNFDLAAGQLLLIEGPNGSGKTSLLRVIVGLVQPQDGTITWRGADIAKQRQAYHDELVWLGHRLGFKGDLTVAENLRAEAGLRRMSAAPDLPVFEQLGIAALTGLPFRVLSAGQQRRVALARLLRVKAVLWLMDEPFTNLDAGGQALVTKLLQAHLAGGGTAVVATHHELNIDASVQRIRLI
ncbi:MAG: cytochrome c biogenesis heme-transporting ATPase CcmA [Woeseia sp.]